MQDAEAVLLVDDYEAKAREGDGLLNDCVRAYDGVDFSGGDVSVQTLLLGGLERADE